MPVDTSMYNTKAAPSGISNTLSQAQQLMKLRNQISPYGSGTGAVLAQQGAGQPYTPPYPTEPGNER